MPSGAGAPNSRPRPKPRRSWRYWFRILHRDFGYFLFALVAVYAVSGIAVNHIGDWNPNYSSSVRQIDLGPLPTGSLDELQTEVISRAGVHPHEVRGRHRKSATRFIVFLPDGGEVNVDVPTGKGTLKRIDRRAVLFEFNVLHLNHLKGVWTWVADGFSLLLLGVAITGIFMLPGRKGLAGRGKWLVAGGLVIPIAFLIVYYSTR